ncbi:hypothetical protein RFI_10396 [Reticulomyxa filosa]|uniref:Uncharacterized protein n=1 Tax=Reticulomyxa filosa TaxID=46433 RepID=X6NLX5_RETFI|nr:hypothetical protein RFI_10396 [Reticulomyxa filosa]|eukprot:ETO26739.1 hypothetical protein RFI_10396 [Reticulomyxa filosa]
MLSLIEIAQFQKHMLTVFPSLSTLATGSCLFENGIHLPETLPQSILLRDKEFIEDDVNMFLTMNSEMQKPENSIALDKSFLYCKVVVFHLFHRYIVVGSEYYVFFFFFFFGNIINQLILFVCFCLINGRMVGLIN